jgi:hypothetical protein
MKDQAVFYNNKLYSEDIHTALLLYGSWIKFIAID